MTSSYEIYKAAKVEMEAGHYDEAIELFRQSVAVEPHFKAFELMGECMVKLGRSAEAVGPMAAAVALNDGVRAASLLADIFMDMGKTLEAKRMAEMALQRDPSNRTARRIQSELS